MILGTRPYQVAELEVVRLSTKDPLAWALMPQLRERVLAFAIAHGQAQIEEIVKRLDQGFVTDSEKMAVWVVARKLDGRVVGHLIAQDDAFGGHPVGFVLQLAAERLPDQIANDVLGELDAWSKAQGHTRVLMVTKRFAFRAWWKRFGFRIFRAIMVRELPP